MVCRPMSQWVWRVGCWAVGWPAGSISILFLLVNGFAQFSALMELWASFADSSISLFASISSGLIWKLHNLGAHAVENVLYSWRMDPLIMGCSSVFPVSAFALKGVMRMSGRRGKVGLPWICPILIQPGTAPGVCNCYLLVLFTKIIWAHSLYFFFLYPQSPGRGPSQVRCWTTWGNWSIPSSYRGRRIASQLHIHAKKLCTHTCIHACTWPVQSEYVTLMDRSVLWVPGPRQTRGLLQIKSTCTGILGRVTDVTNFYRPWVWCDWLTECPTWERWVGFLLH